MNDMPREVVDVVHPVAPLSDTVTTTPWQRLGRLLVARRIELGFRVRKEFAKAHGLKYDRLLFDLENAKRTNYESGTLAHFEQLYRWAPGSIQQVLDGGEPIPADQPYPRSQARPIEEFTSQELLAELSKRIATTDRRVDDVLNPSDRPEAGAGGAAAFTEQQDTGHQRRGFVPRAQPDVGT